MKKKKNKKVKSMKKIEWTMINQEVLKIYKDEIEIEERAIRYEFIKNHQYQQYEK
jgi:hypothetical protein